MFLFSSESLNYTQARSFCHKWNASLAHVISEERTEGLGKLVSQNVSSFVGLSSSNEERIWKNEFGIRNSCPLGFIRIKRMREKGGRFWSESFGAI